MKSRYLIFKKTLFYLDLYLMFSVKLQNKMEREKEELKSYIENDSKSLKDKLEKEKEELQRRMEEENKKLQDKLR